MALIKGENGMKKLLLLFISMFMVSKTLSYTPLRKSASVAAPTDLQGAKNAIADLSKYVDLKQNQLDAIPDDAVHAVSRSAAAAKIQKAQSIINKAQDNFVKAVETQYGL